MTMGSWCQWAARQSPQLEAVLAQALLELAVTPDTELLERGGAGDLRVVCKARLRLTDVMVDIMMQHPSQLQHSRPTVYWYKRRSMDPLRTGHGCTLHQGRRASASTHRKGLRSHLRVARLRAASTANPSTKTDLA